MARTALYRHFDADGRLLYVGLSATPMLRTRTHMNGADWRDAITSVLIESHETREAAEVAERIAIQSEAPAHNKTWAKTAPHDSRAAPEGAFRRALLYHMAVQGTSITDLVRASGVSRDVINKIKARAGASTSVENAIAIAAFYGETVNEFMLSPPGASA